MFTELRFPKFLLLTYRPTNKGERMTRTEARASADLDSAEENSEEVPIRGLTSSVPWGIVRVWRRGRHETRTRPMEHRHPQDDRRHDRDQQPRRASQGDGGPHDRFASAVEAINGGEEKGRSRC